MSDVSHFRRGFRTKLVDPPKALANSWNDAAKALAKAFEPFSDEHPTVDWFCHEWLIWHVRGANEFMTKILKSCPLGTSADWAVRADAGCDHRIFLEIREPVTAQKQVTQ